MTLKQIRTTQYLRYGRAAYAEDNNGNIDAITAQIAVEMSDPASRFYKVEINENGAFVGFFIIQNGRLVNAHMRPHFQVLSAEFTSLLNMFIQM